VQPAVDPRAVGLLGEGGAVPQFGEPGLRASDQVEDVREPEFSAADRAEGIPVRRRDGQRDCEDEAMEEGLCRAVTDERKQFR